MRKPAVRRAATKKPATKTLTAKPAARPRAARTGAGRLDVPRLGVLARDGYDRLVSRPVRVPALGRACVFELEGYEGDKHPEDFDAAIANLLAQRRTLLTDASYHVYQYCRDALADFGADELTREDAQAQGLRELAIARPADVWKHVELGGTLTVGRDHGRGRTVYISLECNCAWEPEHGLQLVFENGVAVSKIGPFDGHMTNVSAYDDRKLKGVVYVP